MTSREEALELFHSDDLIDIGMRADEVRRRHHPGGVVSYIVDRNIIHSLDRQVIFDKIQETIDLGGTGIRLSGKTQPNLDIEWHEELLRDIKQRFDIHCHYVSVPEASGICLGDAITRLRHAGLDSLSDSGIEDIQDWIHLHRTAHSLGMPTTATMMSGSMSDLELVRNLQEETGGFRAFTPRVKEDATAVEYLKTLAISRIYLDNIVNIQSPWVAPGMKTCQVALRFGSNDVGSIMIKENVLSHHRATEEELRRLIRDAGFIPKQRDTLYTKYFLN